MNRGPLVSQPPAIQAYKDVASAFFTAAPCNSYRDCTQRERILRAPCARV